MCSHYRGGEDDGPQFTDYDINLYANKAVVVGADVKNDRKDESSRKVAKTIPNPLDKTYKIERVNQNPDKARTRDNAVSNCESEEQNFGIEIYEEFVVYTQEVTSGKSTESFFKIIPGKSPKK
jgi:hypothetical protein